MPTPRVLSLFVALPLLLAGCATMTPYQPLRNGEGYSEQRIESHRYRVLFTGNAATPRQTVENYLLFRAAELTLAAGYDYFVLSHSDTDAKTRYQETISAFGGTGFYSRYSGFGIGIGTAYPITEYKAQAYVTMFKGERPTTQPDAFDAREVKANLAPAIKYPDAR